MRPTKAAFGVLLLVGGCTAAPERVSLDLSALPAEAVVQTAPVQTRTEPASPRNAAFEAKSEVRLFESLSSGEEERIVQALAESRINAFNRALQSLRRQYSGLVEAERAAAQQAVREADESDWQETQDDLREIFDRYAPQEGRLRIRLAALRPTSRSSTLLLSLRRQLEAALREALQKNVEQWEQDLEALKAEFQAELQPVLEAYHARKESREGVVAQIARDLETQLEEEARRQARLIVETTFDDVYDFEAVLDDVVPPVDALEVASPGVPETRTALPSKTVSSQTDLESQAKIFAESRGYNLVSPGPAARDVTQEFIEWRKTYGLGL